MQIMQTFHLTFADGNKKSVIIHEYGNKFVMMVADDGWFRYFPDGNKPKIYDTAIEAFDEISNLRKFSNAKKIQTTNEFIKVEELKEKFTCEILGV
jgi:hypothetical protein